MPSVFYFTAARAIATNSSIFKLAPPTSAPSISGWKRIQPRENHELSAVIMTVDLVKRDVEIKLVLGCTEEETQIAFKHLNNGEMRARLIRRS